MDTAPASPRSRPPPVGRDRELAVARDLLAAALAGRGSLLLIGGEAGVGKTAVVEAIAREAAEAGARVLLGGCYDRTETAPYGPWVEGLAQGGMSGRRNAPPAPAPPDPTAAPSQETFFAQTRGYLAALAEATPILLVLEDLHWADAASLHMLRSLARAPSLAPLRLLLAATYRNDELDRSHPLAEVIPILVREAPVERIDLRPLDLEAAVALVRARYALSDPEAGRLAAYLIQRSEGNALFMTEVLRTLEEEHVLVREDGAWRSGTFAHAPVPPLLRQVIDARVMRLGQASYALLAEAAVIGQEVPLAVWRAVTRTDEDDLVELAERAEAAHLIAAWAGGDGIRFTHALIREVLYDGVYPMRRRRLHRRIGEVLAAAPSPDPDAVAYHLQQAGDGRAVEWLVRAAERAADSSAPMAAATRYAAAADLLDAQQGDPAGRGWLRLVAGSLRHYQDPTGANESVEEAAHLAHAAGDASLAARTLAMRGLLRAYRGELRDGIADLAAATAAIDRLPSATGPARRREERIDRIANRGTLIAFLAYAGRLAQARAEGERLLATPAASTPGWVGTVADVHTGLSLAYALQGEPTLATRSYAAAVGAYRQMGHHVLANAKQREEISCVVMPYRADDLALRARAITTAEAETQRLADAGTHGAVDPRYARLPLLVLEGQWREAHQIADVDQWNVQQQIRHLNFVLGPLARAQGDPDRAWRCVRESWPDGPATEFGERFVPFTVPLLLLGAALALDDGDLDGARAWLDAHGAWLDWMGATLGRADGQALEAAWWRASGDPVRAREHAERALRHAAAPRQPLVLLAAHRLLGSLDAGEGRGGTAEEHFAAALALADACHAPYERALVLLARAECAVTVGDGTAAFTLLEEVKTLGAPLDARPLLARVEALAKRLGDDGRAVAGPSSRSSPLPEGLSAREVEVLRLVAEGLTNPRIAERLFLSPRTVSSHLVSIYGKLGVTTRAAATRAAIERGLV